MKTSDLEERIEKLVGKTNMIREDYASLNTIVNDILERVRTLEDKQNELEEKLNKKINVYDIYMRSFDKDIDIISQRIDKIEEKDTDKELKNRVLKIGDKVFINLDGKPEGSDTPAITSTMRTYNHKIGTVVGFGNYAYVEVSVNDLLPYFYHPDWLIKVEE